MNDTELFALSVLVQSSALGMKAYDDDRLRMGCPIGYGDMAPEGHDELHAELKRRGIICAPPQSEKEAKP